MGMIPIGIIQFNRHLHRGDQYIEGLWVDRDALEEIRLFLVLRMFIDWEEENQILRLVNEAQQE